MREKRPPASRSSPAAFIVAGQLKNAQVKPESSVDVDVGVDGGVDDGVDDIVGEFGGANILLLRGEVSQDCTSEL